MGFVPWGSEHSCAEGISRAPSESSSSFSSSSSLSSAPAAAFWELVEFDSISCCCEIGDRLVIWEFGDFNDFDEEESVDSGLEVTGEVIDNSVEDSEEIFAEENCELIVAEASSEFTADFLSASSSWSESKASLPRVFRPRWFITFPLKVGTLNVVDSEEVDLDGDLNINWSWGAGFGFGFAWMVPKPSWGSNVPEDSSRSEESDADGGRDNGPIWISLGIEGPLGNRRKGAVASRIEFEFPLPGIGSRVLGRVSSSSENNERGLSDDFFIEDLKFLDVEPEHGNIINEKQTIH